MRKSSVVRKTKETNIKISLNLDGKGNNKIDTPIPFLNHMLNLFSFHSLIDLEIKASGDTEIDYHHIIEDLGITMGEAIKKSLQGKSGIKRYGEATIPMDETLSRVIIDLSGRPFLSYKVKPERGNINGLEISLFEDFFRALTNNAMANIHIIVEYGKDMHHIFESIFKGFGRALRQAIEIDPKRKSLPSTKGKL